MTVPFFGASEESDRRLRRLQKRIDRMNTWLAIKHGPEYSMRLMAFEEKRRLTRTKKQTIMKYGLSIHGKVPQVGPLTFEEMLHYLDTEALK